MRPPFPAWLSRAAPDWLAALALALFCGAFLIMLPN